jgi:glycosyltransferase involved in cell wall biosynthesis
MAVKTEPYKLRVANIIEEGKLGGPQIRMITIANEIDNMVHTTIIMPTENSENFQKKCKEKKISYCAMSMTRITKEWLAILRYIFFSFIEIARLYFFIKKENFDLVHVSGGSWQYKGVIAGKMAGKKVVWHINDTMSPVFIRSIFFMINNLSDGFIYASNRSKEYYGSLIGESLEFIIPAPVDTEFFSPFGEFCGDERLIGSWSDKLVVGTVANINPVKDLEVFIRSASEVNKLIDNVVFVIVGPVYKRQQKYYKALKRLCVQLNTFNVKFVGGRDDTRPLLKRFDVYVCTSYAESSPISVWEALSMGKPIVSTNVGDVDLYVTNNGYVAQIKDFYAISRYLIKLITNKDKMKRFGELSRMVAVNNLNKEKCAKLHVDAYKKILSNA